MFAFLKPWSTSLSNLKYITQNKLTNLSSTDILVYTFFRLVSDMQLVNDWITKSTLSFYISSPRHIGAHISHDVIAWRKHREANWRTFEYFNEMTHLRPPPPDIHFYIYSLSSWWKAEDGSRMGPHFSNQKEKKIKWKRKGYQREVFKIPIG